MKLTTGHRVRSLRVSFPSFKGGLQSIQRKIAKAIDQVIDSSQHVTAEPLESRTLFAANLLDTTFGGGDGVVTTDIAEGFETAHAVTLLGSGKILVAGQAVGANPGSGIDFALVRYSAAGVRDTTFGGGDGIVTTGIGAVEDVARAVAVLSNGKILVAGTAANAEGQRDIALARFNANGTPDLTFGGGDGKVTTPLGDNTDDDGRAMLTLPDGDILIAGSVYDNVDRRFAVVRYNANGSLDTSFGDNNGIAVTDVSADFSNEQASAIARGPGSTFYVGGQADGRGIVARYKTDGTPDNTFDADGVALTNNYGFGYDNSGVGIATLGDGDVLLAGNYFSDSCSVARFNPDGSSDASFGSNGELSLQDPTYADSHGTPLAVLPNGKILIGLGGQTIARLTPDGFSDPTFYGEDGVFQAPFSNASGEFQAMTLLPDGRAVLAGRIVEYGGRASGEPQFGLMQIKNPQSSVLADNDDQINEALTVTVGGSRTGAINPGIDVDMYKVTVVAGQRLAFDLDRAVGSTLDSVLRVFDRSGNELASNDDAAAPGESVGTTESYVRAFFSEAGTYYIGVSGSANGSYEPLSGNRDVVGSLGGYILRATNVPIPVDTDDQIAEAVSLSVAAVPRAGTLGNDLDVDMVKFTVLANQRIGFDVDVPASSALDPYLRVFAADGAELTASDNDAAPGEQPGVESYREWTFASAGTYYAAVSSSANAGYDSTTGAGDVPGSTGPYTLDLLIVQSDPNDQISEAITLNPGAPQSSSISPATDVDMFRFSVTAGNFVQLDIDRAAGSTLDSWLRLFDGDGQQLLASDNDTAPGEGFSLDSYIAWTAPATGTYYVGVSGSGNSGYTPVSGTDDGEGSKGAYGLTLTLSDAPTDPSDPDDQILEAIPLGSEPVDAAINPSRDVDIYSITVAAPQTVEFDIDTQSDFDSLLRLFDSDGNELAANDDFNGADSLINYTFEAAGTFYIGVSPLGNGGYNPLTGLDDSESSTGPYRLTVRRIPSDPDDQIAEAASIAAGVTRNAAIDPRTDVDLYAVAIAAGEEWTFETLTPSSDLLPVLRLFNSDGQEVAGEASGTESSRIGFAFEFSGTYYLGVSGYSNVSYNANTGLGDSFASSGTYQLTAQRVPPDRDDQVSEATALTLGVASAGTIGVPTDVDIFRFSAVAGRLVAIDLDRPAGGIAGARLRLFDASGSEVSVNSYTAAPDETADQEAYLEFLPTSSGTFYVGVSGPGNDGYSPVTGNGDQNATSTGAYTLRVGDLLSDGDDQLAEAVTVAVGGSKNGTISNIADVDMIKFTVAAGQRIAIDLDRASGSGLDSFLRLFSSAGSDLRSSDDTPAPGEAPSTESYIERVFSRSGTFYIGVSSHNNSTYDPITTMGKRGGTTTGGYVLRINLLS